MVIAGLAGGASRAGPSPAAADTRATPATILIVDDEPANRRLLEAVLRREHYLTIHAADGESALSEIARHAPDLILLDLKMPGIDGYQVARALKDDPGTSNIPIIVVTVLADRDARIAALTAGAEEFVTKPIDPRDLLLRVRNLLRLKSLGDFLRNHGVLLEQQVKARTAALGRFSAAMDTTADALYLVDRGSMRFLHVNDAACRMQSRTREALLAMGPELVFETTRPELELAYDALIAGSGARPLDLLRIRKDGSQAWEEIRRHAHLSEERWLIVTLVRDVTDRRVSGDKIGRLNRLSSMLSGITTLIVHVRERQELFREACRIAVEDGKFAMAWIGSFDPVTRNVTPVAWAGEAAEELTRAESSASADTSRGTGAVGQSIRARRPVFNNNILTQGSGGPRLEEIARLGFQSHITLPLYENQAVAGTFTMYAREPDFFDDDEVRLLTALAADISFALESIGREHRLGKPARDRVAASPTAQ